MSEFEKLVSQLTPEVYRSLRTAVELGKWPDGRVLTEQQRETSMQAVLTYEVKNNLPEEQRTGYMEGGGFTCGSSNKAASTNNSPAKADLAYRVGK